MATKAKRSASAPRRPEKKWGPFHGEVGIAVWLNEVQTDAGPKFFRSNVVMLVMWCRPSSCPVRSGRRRPNAT